MSTKLNELKQRLRNLAEYSENKSVVLARESVDRLETFEQNLEHGLNELERLCQPNLEGEALREIEAAIADCREWLK